MDDVNEHCLAPFRRVLGEANTAMETSRGNEAMRTAAHMLYIAGEFALQQLEPPCTRRYAEHGNNFVNALRNNGDIRELRMKLDQQVYVFHRYLMGNEFIADKYTELESITSDAGFKMLEAVINMNLDAAPLGPSTLPPALVNQFTQPSLMLPLNYPAPVTPPGTSIQSSPSPPPMPPLGSARPGFQNPEHISRYSERHAVDERERSSAGRSQVPSQSSSTRPRRPTDNDVDPDATGYGRRPLLHTPTQSTANCEIEGTSSFHLLGGFCKGAEKVTLGLCGVKKPSWIAGIVGSNLKAKCIACYYEVSWKDIEEDDSKQDIGNKKQSDIGYRLRFLRKSHVCWERPDDVVYACVFCVRDGRTINPSDPTVFITTKALFRHIARHSRPLPKIPGFLIIEAPTVPPEHHNDYDLHFSDPPLAHPVLGRERQVASLPRAVAKKVARGLYNQRQLRDKSRVHEVLVGARITGLEWPDKYNGEWCTGWHDGVYGSVLFDILQLEPPLECDVQRDGTSRVKATARFKFSHKDNKKTAWLKFEKNEIITNISWVHPEHWCCSGTNSKGDWGIFPKAFVMNLSSDVVV